MSRCTTRSMQRTAYLTPSRVSRFQGSKGIGCIPDDENVWVSREPDLSVACPDSKLERARDVRSRPVPVVNRFG